MKKVEVENLVGLSLYKYWFSRSDYLFHFSLFSRYTENYIVKLRHMLTRRYRSRNFIYLRTLYKYYVFFSL